ncbi:hypothetical protein [Actinophytocola sp.]|uniref:hypothetical protein n=1 Tax=Actinophytocola sp. TaxID=1872138 RepID=UPI003D6B94E4
MISELAVRVIKRGRKYGNVSCGVAFSVASRSARRSRSTSASGAIGRSCSA